MDFQLQGPDLPAPVITLPIVDEALRELDWVVEHGAKVILIRPAPCPASKVSDPLPCLSSTPSGQKCRNTTSRSACIHLMMD